MKREINENVNIKTTNPPENKGLQIFIAILGIEGIGALIAFIAYAIARNPWIQTIYILSVALLPIIGIGGTLLLIWKKYTMPTIVDVGQFGTLIRNSKGQLQIIGAQEMYALESIQDIPIQEAEPETDYIESFPRPFPELEAPMPVSIPEIDAEIVMEKLKEEKEFAKQELDARQREVTKERIRKLAGMGIGMSNIANIVHMQGRRYKEFQVLYEEAMRD